MVVWQGTDDTRRTQHEVFHSMPFALLRFYDCDRGQVRLCVVGFVSQCCGAGAKDIAQVHPRAPILVA
jgi:hypothetical protein